MSLTLIFPVLYNHKSDIMVIDTDLENIGGVYILTLNEFVVRYNRKGVVNTNSHISCLKHPIISQLPLLPLPNHNNSYNPKSNNLSQIFNIFNRLIKFTTNSVKVDITNKSSIVKDSVYLYNSLHGDQYLIDYKLNSTKINENFDFKQLGNFCVIGLSTYIPLYLRQYFYEIDFLDPSNFIAFFNCDESVKTFVDYGDLSNPELKVSSISYFTAIKLIQFGAQITGSDLSIPNILSYLPKTNPQMEDLIKIIEPNRPIQNIDSIELKFLENKQDDLENWSFETNAKSFTFSDIVASKKGLLPKNEINNKQVDIKIDELFEVGKLKQIIIQFLSNGEKSVNEMRNFVNKTYQKSLTSTEFNRILYNSPLEFQKVGNTTWKLNK